MRRDSHYCMTIILRHILTHAPGGDYWDNEVVAGMQVFGHVYRRIRDFLAHLIRGNLCSRKARIQFRLVGEGTEWCEKFAHSERNGYTGQPSLAEGFFQCRVRAIQGHSYPIDRTGARDQEPLTAEWFRSNEVLRYHATYRLVLPSCTP